METWHFLVMVIVVNSAIWTFFDASRQRDAFHIGVGPSGRPPHLWASWVLLLMPVGFTLYLQARGTAQLAEPRPGPPPRFTTSGFNFYGVSVGLVGLGIFATLIVFGQFRLASLGLVVAAAGLFGGRTAKMTGEDEDAFGLGEMGLEQVGFRTDIEEQGADDKEMVNVEAYFADLAAPNPPRPQSATTPRAPQAAGQKVPPAPPSAPYAPGPAGPSPPAGAPYAPGSVPQAPPPSPVAPPPAVAAPGAQGVPHQVAPAQAPPAPPYASVAPPAVPQPSAPPSPPRAAAPREPAPGMVYSPPPAGVVYAPGHPGGAAAVPPSAPSPVASPAAAPAAHPHASDSRATVALSEAAVAAELRSQSAARQPVSPGPGAPPPGAPPPGAPPPGAPPPGAPPPAARHVTPQAAGDPFAPLIPPSPSAAPGPTHAPLVPPPPSARPRPKAYGYAASAGGSKKGLPLPWLVGALAGLAALAAGGYYVYFMSPAADPQGGAEIVAEDLDAVGEVAAPDEEEAPPVEFSEAVEEGVADEEEMAEWVEDYADVMGTLAVTLDEIDFEGMETERCQSLRRQLSAARRRLGNSPDADVDKLLAKAFNAFGEGVAACRNGDEPAWALALLNGKAATHEAQEVMDRRYLYRGVLELELESETGAVRSTASISGRFLDDAEALP